jgi:hypothetical protein
MTNKEAIVIVALVYVEVAVLALYLAVRLRRLYRFERLQRRLEHVVVFSQYLL